MCVAVIVYGAVAVFVDAIIVGVLLIAVGVIKIFVSLIIVHMNCNTIVHAFVRDVCVVAIVAFAVVKSWMLS